MRSAVDAHTAILRRSGKHRIVSGNVQTEDKTVVGVDPLQHLSGEEVRYEDHAVQPGRHCRGGEEEEEER